MSRTASAHAMPFVREAADDDVGALRACGSSALSMRIRRTCATRSGSHVAPRSARGQPQLEVRAVRRQRRHELATSTARASTADVGRARGAARASRPPAARGPAARSSASAGARPARAPAPRNARARLLVEVLVLRAARRSPPSEKIGVRSSCEAVAMKRLRAESSWASWRCMSSSARASWPSSSPRVDREPRGEVAARPPGAAARSRRRMRRAQRARDRAGRRAPRRARRERAGDEDRAGGSSATVSATSLSGVENTDRRARCLRS